MKKMIFDEIRLFHKNRKLEFFPKAMTHLNCRRRMKKEKIVRQLINLIQNFEVSFILDSDWTNLKASDWLKFSDETTPTPPITTRSESNTLLLDFPTVSSYDHSDGMTLNDPSMT